MSVWSNKHVVIATLMAPVLALIAYFGVNTFLGETPHAAAPGESYELVEKPNCRYSSGMCGLKNGEFELTLTYQMRGTARMLLSLESVHPLEGVLLAMIENDSDEQPPVEMQATSSDGLHWSLDLARPDPEIHRLRLVASAEGALYFGDAATSFTVVESSEY